MAQPILALDADPDLDLAAFCRELWRRRVNHRVITQEGRRLVLVATREDAEKVNLLYQAWRSGEIGNNQTVQEGGAAESAISASGKTSTNWKRLLIDYPVVSGVVGLAMVCYPVTWSLGQNELNAALSALNFVPVTEVAARLQFTSLSEALSQGQVWRLVSPVFLHFSVMHLLFDVAVVVEFGRRVEAAIGSLRFLFLFLLLSVTSNLTQYLFQGAGLFGGLSGVAYGLLGFVVVMHRLQPVTPHWAYQRPLVISLLVFLAVFSTGITEPFGLYIANAAHWSGLAAGSAVAALVAWRQTA